MTIRTKYALGDTVQYEAAECKIIRVKVLQDLYTDKQPRIYYYLTRGEGIEVRAWAAEEEIWTHK